MQAGQAAGSCRESASRRARTPAGASTCHVLGTGVTPALFLVEVSQAGGPGDDGGANPQQPDETREEKPPETALTCHSGSAIPTCRPRGPPFCPHQQPRVKETPRVIKAKGEWVPAHLMLKAGAMLSRGSTWVSLPWLLVCSTSSRARGFRRCRFWALEHRLSSGTRAQLLLVPRACGIFPDRDQTHVSCIGSCVTRKG